jgi:hypothetical protein
MRIVIFPKMEVRKQNLPENGKMFAAPIRTCRESAKPKGADFRLSGDFVDLLYQALRKPGTVASIDKVERCARHFI